MVVMDFSTLIKKKPEAPEQAAICIKCRLTYSTCGTSVVFFVYFFVYKFVWHHQSVYVLYLYYMIALMKFLHLNKRY